ncbi:hypothetical protein EGW08_011939 [Elysia chlorotica]|uniref:Uncharacterized protein n=1 Tax=Elysia chlorotica TaxID=188477 RepID=A0A3S1BBP1_ELYCH|nr:hypothetical protein EGW08_011939 [Elysia chlorotica]
MYNRVSYGSQSPISGTSVNLALVLEVVLSFWEPGRECFMSFQRPAAAAVNSRSVSMLNMYYIVHVQRPALCRIQAPSDLVDKEIENQFVFVYLIQNTGRRGRFQDKEVDKQEEEGETAEVGGGGGGGELGLAGPASSPTRRNERAGRPNVAASQLTESHLSNSPGAARGRLGKLGSPTPRPQQRHTQREREKEPPDGDPLQQGKARRILRSGLRQFGNQR